LPDPATPDPPQEDKETASIRDDRHAALVDIVLNSEAITWNRFNNFLMFNSIMLLGWATIYAPMTQSEPQGRTCATVLSVICALGLLSCLVWPGLGLRGRRYLALFSALGARAEREGSTGDHPKPRPLSASVKSHSSGVFSWSGSLYVVTLGPIAFAALYDILLYASVHRVSRAWGLLQSGAAAMVILLLFLVLVVRLHEFVNTGPKQRLKEYDRQMEELDRELFG